MKKRVVVVAVLLVLLAIFYYFVITENKKMETAQQKQKEVKYDFETHSEISRKVVEDRPCEIDKAYAELRMKIPLPFNIKRQRDF